MKLLGRDISARELISRIEERLRLRGLPTSEAVEVPAGGVEPRVEPLTFNLHALEEHADATRALPLHTHRGGAGQLVLVAKWAFRKSCQVFINEALGRQRVFNGHVRDSYAQLSAEVIRLRREVEQLRARQAGMPPEDDRRPVAAKADGPPKAPAAEPVREVSFPSTQAAPSPAARPPSSGKAPPRTKSVEPTKPTRDSRDATPMVPEAVLPRPRGARKGASQPPRPSLETTGQTTPPDKHAGSRPPPPGPKRSSHRKKR